MPNWCECDLRVIGPSEVINAMLAHVGAVGEKPRIDPNKIIPYPARLAQQDAEYLACGEAARAAHDRWVSEELRPRAVLYAQKNGLLPDVAEELIRRGWAQLDPPLPREPSSYEYWRAFEDKYGGRKDGYNCGGYNWCIANWGTKWPPSDVRVTVDGDGDENVLVQFETPWAPPCRSSRSCTSCSRQ